MWPRDSSAALACVCSRCAAAVGRKAAGSSELASLGCLDGWMVLTYGRASPAGLFRVILVGVAEEFSGQTRYGGPQVTALFQPLPATSQLVGVQGAVSSAEAGTARTAPPPQRRPNLPPGRGPSFFPGRSAGLGPRRQNRNVTSSSEEEA